MAANPKPVDDQPVAIPRLSQLELSVVALAQHSGERVVGLPSRRATRFVRILMAIVGRRSVGPLANVRLEALRRLAVVLYHRSDRGAATIARFLAAGLSIGDIDAVRAAVGSSPRLSRRRPYFCAAGIFASTMALAGCATVGQDRIAERDPLQKFNRGMWSVNQDLDKVVIKPVSVAYRKVVPRVARRGVTGIFANLSEPWSAVNNLLQLKPGRAARNLGRFAVNTTVGVGGLGDPATKMGIRTAPEDLGQTLATWGVGGGPYLVLPLFGPSTLRDGVGILGAQFGDPVSIAKSSANLPSAVTLGATALEIADGRSRMTEAGFDETMKNSPDAYADARSAFLQQRRIDILNQEAVITIEEPRPSPDIFTPVEPVVDLSTAMLVTAAR